MANHYMATSFKVIVAPEQLERAEAVAQAARATIQDRDGYVGIQVRRDLDEHMGDGIWFYQEENLDVAHAVEVLQQLVNELDLLPTRFTWATWCDKPQLNAFGGGAVCVRKGMPAEYADCC